MVRIVSWNCCDAFSRKFGHLERLNPEIAVVSEVRPECIKSAGLSERSAWVGDVGQKGLAVIGYGNWRIVGTGPAVAERWLMPAVLSDGLQTVQIVAVWLDTTADCVPPTLSALQQLRSFITSAPTIITGDFNQSVVFDAKRGKGRRFSEVLSILGNLGLVSAWHQSRGERYGEESAATLYWRWQEASRFHIDYLFYPPDQMALRDCTLGTYEQYVAAKISDHVPLSIDLFQE